MEKEPHFSNSALLNNTLNNQNNSNVMTNLSSSQNGNPIPNFNNFSNIKLAEPRPKFPYKNKQNSKVSELIIEDEHREEDSDVNLLQILRNEENLEKELEEELEDKNG